MNLKTKYGGVDVEYDERENVWVFEVRGRERKVESLAKAKQIIDKPEPQEKPPFTRFKAWYKDYCGVGFVLGEVTSEAANSSAYSNTKHYWFVVKKERSKIRYNDLYPQNENNDAVIKQLIEIQEQISTLRKQQLALEDKLKSCE